ncbi:autotransporter outer membrane beta-barrel domain-containing protein [Pollutimonas bauzanensis]|uniref:autotransporter family protein n=1 Tax=Pollutimonas bauzanensis TaxID=658167 RepID=UPI00333EB71D
MRLAIGAYFVSGGLWILPSQDVQAQQVVADGITLPASGIINTEMTGWHGLSAYNNGVINTVGPVFITTGGRDANGAFANSGGLIMIDGGSIITRGVQAKGLFAFLGDARITATNSMILTQQDFARGAEANISGHIVLNGGSVTTLGKSAEGLYTIDRNATLGATDTTVLTSGANSHGAHALLGTITLNNVGITTTGQGAGGARADNGSVLSITGGRITTYGASAFGALAIASSTSTLENVTIATQGESAFGLAAQFGSDVRLTGGSVSTTGQGSAGLFAVGKSGATTLSGARIDANDLLVSTSGVSSHAAVVRGGSAISLNNSTLQTLGRDSHGLYASAYDTDASTFTLTGSSLSADQGAAIHAHGTVLNVSMDSSTVVGGSAVLSAAGNAGAPATLNVAASNSALKGAAYTEAGSRSALSLASGSVWNMTGDSVLTDLTLDSGAVFSTPFTENVYKTLTINNLDSADGVIGLNAYLAGDGSPSDQVVIDSGRATGQTRLRIQNTGGAGALTTESGIQIVKTINDGQTNERSFVLDGRVVAGAYEYQLYRSGSQLAEADNWYLRSQRDPDAPVLPKPDPPVSPDPEPSVPILPDPDPSAPVLPESDPPIAPPLFGATPAPLYRPEVAAYLANQRLVGQMFVQSLHDRQGSLQLTGNGQDTTSSDKHGSAWLRSTRTWGASNSQDANFHVDTDLLLLQGGGDVAKWGVGSQAGRIHVGTMFGYGVADSKVRADGNTAQARGKVEGYNGGVYATWFQNADTQLGAYVDLWTQYGWFNNRVEGEGLPAVRYDSRAWSVSGEAGYAFKASGDWMIEPQAQLTYVRVKTDSVTEDNGTQVDQANSHSVISRLGVRTYRNIELNHGRRVQPFATVNWWHTRADSTVSFDALQMGQLYPKNRAELKVGVNADLAKGWTGWASLAGSWGAQGYHQYGGRVGVKYTW